MIVSMLHTTKIVAPFGLVVENANDWTHFKYLHRKSHAEFKLLHKEGSMEIFFYKARIFYPLPFYNYYICFREAIPSQNGYRQVYLDLRTGKTHFLDSRTLDEGSTVSILTDFRFAVSQWWKLWPGLFGRLYKRGMREVIREDCDHLRERIQLGAFSNDKACAEICVPEKYDFYLDYFKNGIPKAQIFLEGRLFEDLKTGPA